MKKAIIVALMLIFCSIAISAHAFNCGEGGRYLATTGMHKYKILKNCGPPMHKEKVGVDIKKRSVRIIEEWVYIVDWYGHKNMYMLRINAKGVVAEIVYMGEKE